MKILFLSWSDSVGGATISTLRLFHELERREVDVTMLAHHHAGPSPRVRAPKGYIGRLVSQARRPVEMALTRWRHRRLHEENFMAPRLPNGLGREIAALAPDLVHVHFVGHGFLRPDALSGLRCPILWTLHDMWPLTGGCYYTGPCRRFEGECGRCPALESESEGDCSRGGWRAKQRAWRGLNLTLVSPSQWLAGEARSSSLHRQRRVEVIPYGLNLQRFQPWPKAAARRMLGLPEDAPLLLFGSAGLSGKRKGFHLLLEALRQVMGKLPDLQLVVFGGEPPRGSLDGLGLRWHGLGVLRDEISTALAYSAADVFAAPSMEDNLPNTVLEATACGTPVVAFRVGGIPDMVEHGRTGLLASPFEVAELGDCLVRLVGDAGLRNSLGRGAREKAIREYAAELQGERYLRLYRELLGKQER